MNDNNIPNGNSIYLTLCNKLYAITDNKTWYEKIEILNKSFHQVLNSNFSQMFSFIKSLDISKETISFTFYGDPKKTEEIRHKLLKDFSDRAIFVYKNKGNEDPFVVICKNQTCSNKISGINEINAYLRDHKITHDSK